MRIGEMARTARMIHIIGVVPLTPAFIMTLPAFLGADPVCFRNGPGK